MSGPVKDAILSSAVGAIGLLAAAAVLDEKANAVPWVIHVLRNSNIKECYACIRNLAMDENNVETFIAQGGIEVILSKLKENMHEADTVANCLDALASLSENDEAAKRITDSGGIDTCKVRYYIFQSIFSLYSVYIQSIFSVKVSLN